MDGNCINNETAVAIFYVLHFFFYSTRSKCRTQKRKKRNSVFHNNTNFHFPVNNSNRLYRKETDSRIYKYNKCHHHAKWFLPYSCSRNVTSVHRKPEKKRNCNAVDTNMYLKMWKTARTQWHMHTQRVKHISYSQWLLSNNFKKTNAKNIHSTNDTEETNDKNDGWKWKCSTWFDFKRQLRMWETDENGIACKRANKIIVPFLMIQDEMQTKRRKRAQL